MIKKIAAATRYMMYLPVIGSFLAATTLMIYGLLEVVLSILGILQTATFESKEAKTLALSFIETMDLFLIGAACYIIGLGLYELFIKDDLPLPDWLQIHHLDDLKDKLIKVIIVVLGVLFLSKAANWDGTTNLLPIGLAIAAVIVALTYFLNQKASH